MATDLHKLIAAISPDVFCEPESRKKVKGIVKEQLKKENPKAYLEAAKEAKLNATKTPFAYDSAKNDPFSMWGIKSPVEQHELIYDSPSEGLEQVYFWLFDFMNSSEIKPKKIVDNFVSSPGSGHFSELQGKATRMQEEAMKALGAVNQVIKSILNVIYDLRDFQLRLKLYDDYKNGSPERKNAALLSLKQIWMDTVDATKRGTTSLKGLAQQFDYVTIIDAFMASQNLEDVTKKEEQGGLDLNDRVRRILQQRVAEFFDWIELSEKELRKRFEIEKNYLKSQYNTVKLYSRWIKPYLIAAKKLEQPLDYAGNDLVTTFNTIILQLVLRADAKYDVDDDVDSGILPSGFSKQKEKGRLRSVTPFFIVELKFRGIPQKAGQHYVFGGRAEVKFTSYALNEQELKVFEDQIEKDDVDDIMSLIQGATDLSLEQLAEDIEEFIGEKVKIQEKKEEKKRDSDPFTALFSWGFKKKEDWDILKPISPDTDYEKVARSQAIIVAREKAFLVFDVYKKTHGMASHKSPFSSM